MRTLRFGWAAALLGLGAAQASPVWYRVELPQISVYSDAPQREVRDFAIKYAAFYQAFNTLVAPPGRRCPPSNVILFRKLRTLQSYASTTGDSNADSLVSLTSEFDDNSTTALALDHDPTEALLTLCNDNATWMLQQLGLYLPLCVRQGVGEYFATFELDGNHCVIGDSDDRYTRPISDNAEMDWPRFFGVTQDSPEYGLRAQTTDGVYFGQSWELMHTVFSADDVGQSRARFAHLVQLLAAKDTTLDAFAAFFGTRPHNLGGAIHSISHSHTMRMPFDLAATKRTMRVDMAPECDVRSELFELLKTHDKLAAQVQLIQARRLNPRSPVVAIALAHLALMDGDQTTAVKNFQDAIAAGTDDGDAYYYSAKGRLDDAIGEGRVVIASGGDAAVQAVHELKRSLQLRPGSSRTYLELGRADLAAPQVDQAAIAALAPGTSDPRIEGALHFYIGLLYRRVRDPADARLTFLKLVDDPKADDQVRTASREQLEAIAAAEKPKVPSKASAEEAPVR